MLQDWQRFSPKKWSPPTSQEWLFIGSLFHPVMGTTKDYCRHDTALLNPYSGAIAVGGSCHHTILSRRHAGAVYWGSYYDGGRGVSISFVSWIAVCQILSNRLLAAYQMIPKLGTPVVPFSLCKVGSPL